MQTINKTQEMLKTKYVYKNLYLFQKKNMYTKMVQTNHRLHHIKRRVIMDT